VTPTADRLDDLHRLADEQAAIRRVATLVAEGVEGTALFQAAAEEVALVTGCAQVTIDAYEQAASVVLASVNDPAFPVGSRWPLDGPSVRATVLATGKPARIDDFSGLSGPVADSIRRWNVRSAVGAPIIVDGRVWGVVCVNADKPDLVPPGTEARLAHFTALIATAITNGDVTDGLRRLAYEQEALRRVATLVARGAAPNEMFDAVAQEVAAVTAVESVTLSRYESNESVVLASLNVPAFPPGSRWPLEPGTLGATVFATGCPARIHDYSRLEGKAAAAVRSSAYSSAVGVPILVDGRVWGIICVAESNGAGLAGDTEARVSAFTELVATALASIEAREEVRRMASEQAALRRVATLVAEGAPDSELFAAVAEEVAHVLDVSIVTLDRYERDATTTVLATHGPTAFEVGSRWPLDGVSVAANVLETGRPARIDDYTELHGAIAAVIRRRPRVGVAGVPIVVDGTVWGVICAAATERELLPADIEARLRDFTELVATAVANATTRAELIASRARIVAARDEAQRRVERELHDGALQRLIALDLDLQVLQAAVPSGSDACAGLERTRRDLESALHEVREVSRGVHPSLLVRGGLGPALGELARRTPLRVDLSVDAAPRPPESIEIGVYYAIAEAMTNATKHSRATRIVVNVATRGSLVRATIEDDGIGGAQRGAGSGLVGLADRIEALDGRLTLDSPAGHGTTIVLEVPWST
jgi:signal transduction histidine kinase